MAHLRWIAIGVAVMLCSSRLAAQVTPTTGNPVPDDTPSVRVGGTLYADYTRTSAPEITDVNGNRVSQSAFNVTRAYINITGQVNHLVAFRLTPDIARENGTGSSLAGSLMFRLKYGYVQLNLDDWLWRGSYVRAGLVQTPIVDFEENLYRYRFQGTVFTDREGYLTSADFGAAFRTQSPSGRVEVYGGLFNGDGYTRADPNDQKAWQVRGTVRPFVSPGVKRGLRLTIFLDQDHYAQDADRQRVVGMATFEHKFLNAGWTYLDATDQPLLTVAAVDSSGNSIWVNPRYPHGKLQPSSPPGVVRASLEGLFRYDRLEPNHADESRKERWIAGIAYWPRVLSGTVSSAFMLDYEQVRYREYVVPRPTEKRIAVHMLVAF